jgi:hypothetical protein
MGSDLEYTGKSCRKAGGSGGNARLNGSRLNVSWNPSLLMYLAGDTAFAAFGRNNAPCDGEALYVGC